MPDPIIIERDGEKYYLETGTVDCPKCGGWMSMLSWTWYQLLQGLSLSLPTNGGQKQRTAAVPKIGYYTCLWCLHREVRQPNEDGTEMVITEKSDIEWE